MRNRLARAAILLAAIQSTLAFGAADGIFPASTPDAQKAVSWTGNGYFLINGKPTFLSSGEIHYARVPRELWKDRILRAKAMGFNTIQTYVMWNAQEGREGQFDFSGNLDLDAWLTTIQECGMYAIVRPGPYVCAEWENGGLPAWLCDKPDMKVRVDDPQYLKYVDRFEGKVYDIIAKHQLHKGGNVLMVQLENEYPNRWGTDTNSYLDHLRNLARTHGLEIPLFNSGLHHGDDPAGNRPFGARTTPWYSTEFWTGWIGLEGDMNNQKAEQKIRGTWKIIGFGGAGYDYYVVHGGTNFGYSKGAEVAASYDYAAPIGQAGQLRKAYFPMKHAAMFAQAFSDLLTSSKDAPNFVASNTANLQTFTRTSPDGTAVFIADAARFQGGGGRGGRGDTTAPAQVETRIKLADGRELPPITLAPGEICPILTDVFVQANPKDRERDSAKLDYAATKILTRIKLGDKTYIVCFGNAGGTGEVLVKGEAAPIHLAYPVEDSIKFAEIPNSKAQLVIINSSLADRTWIVGEGEKQSLVLGPHYVSPAGTIELDPKGVPGATRIASTGISSLSFTDSMKAIPDLPKLESWQVREGALEALPSTDISKWPTSAQPKPMEQYDDYPNGWGWYRTRIHRDAAGSATLRFGGAGDVVRLYLNGQRIQGDKNGATLSLKAGDNDLAVLCWNEGRPKMYNFTGATGLMAAKGIWGNVTITDKEPAGAATAANSSPQTWSFHAGLDDLQETALIGTVTNWKEFLADTGVRGWAAQPSQPRAANLPTFYRTTFALDPNPALRLTLAVKTTGLRSGSVWLNGHNLGPYRNNGNNAVNIDIPECWLQSGGNTLVIFDAEGADPTRATLVPTETFHVMKVTD